MVADHFIFSVMQLGVRRFECPIELTVCASLASVDLRSCRVRIEDNFFARGNLNRIRNIGRSVLRRGCLAYSGSG
jgi:hypothetical protein